MVVFVEVGHTELSWHHLLWTFMMMCRWHGASVQRSAGAQENGQCALERNVSVFTDAEWS